MDVQFQTSIARLRDNAGNIVGAGFLVGERQILTCAHIVEQALSLPSDTVEAPQNKVQLDFPFMGASMFIAHVVIWQPTRPDGSGDVAGLVLDGDLPSGSHFLSLVVAEDVWGTLFQNLWLSGWAR